MAKGGVFGVILVVSIILASAHSFYFLLNFSKNTPGFAASLLGLSIKKMDANEEPTKNKNSLSLFFIFLEWIFVFALLFFMTFRRRTQIMKEAEELKLKISLVGNHENRTDLDKLYFLLQEKKKISTSAVAKVFSITKDVALKWGQTLESAGLAYVNYPRIGEPEIILNEGAKNE